MRDLYIEAAFGVVVVVWSGLAVFGIWPRRPSSERGERDTPSTGGR